jgi:hypothetical protein
MMQIRSTCYRDGRIGFRICLSDSHRGIQSEVFQGKVGAAMKYMAVNRPPDWTPVGVATI